MSFDDLTDPRRADHRRGRRADVGRHRVRATASRPQRLIDGLLAAGAVGLNIEDTVHKEGKRLRSPEEHAALVGELRKASDAAGVHVVINARTDLFLRNDGDEADRVDRAIARLKLAADAGADSLYPVGRHDDDTMRRLTSELPLAGERDRAARTPTTRRRSARLASAGSALGRSCSGCCPGTRRRARPLEVGAPPRDISVGGVTRRVVANLYVSRFVCRVHRLLVWRTYPAPVDEHSARSGRRE